MGARLFPCPKWLGAVTGSSRALALKSVKSLSSYCTERALGQLCALVKALCSLHGQSDLNPHGVVRLEVPRRASPIMSRRKFYHGVRHPFAVVRLSGLRTSDVTQSTGSARYSTTDSTVELGMRHYEICGGAA